MNLRTRKAVGERSRPRRMRTKLFLAGYAQPSDEPIRRRFHFDGRQLDVELIELRSKSVIRLLPDFVDCLLRRLIQRLFHLRDDTLFSFGTNTALAGSIF